ncbi:MAG: endonuclease/exonuclease/phosphatase family protein [Odoribacteraceae bacterium]|jgi:endonuclease/exonuclease/phosphatase family metal-dependent hydrolase|nr:endonuclease/exonuclease/phosphatase family protein [Odoribacteraceae bacterium]
MKAPLLLALLLPALAAGIASRPDAAPLAVMTFNIRYDNPDDGAFRWSARRASLSGAILRQSPDLIGMQEVLHRQLSDLAADLPAYAHVGVGREDGGTRGEYSPIFYRRDRLALLATGTFWLSETPDRPGKGWDAACERLVTWARLREIPDGRVFYLFNTHFDHVGRLARRQSAALLKERIREIAGQSPVIVTGDFNATADDETVCALVNPADPDHLADALALAIDFAGPRHSYQNFGRLPDERRTLIDYIFVKNTGTVASARVLDHVATSGYISDHYPLLVKLQVN